MAKINWAKLRKNIPKEVKIGRHKFKVEFGKTIQKKNGRYCYGQTEFYPNRIVINEKLKDNKQIVLTYFHEWHHTWCLYKNMHFTENTVMAIESKFEFFRELILGLEGKK